VFFLKLLLKAAARKFDSLSPSVEWFIAKWPSVKSIYFCTSHLAARLPARIAAFGKTCRVFNTVALFHF
jgi:hypothetical protein